MYKLMFHSFFGALIWADDSCSLRDRHPRADRLSQAQYTPQTLLNCRVELRRRCVLNSQLVGDSLEESWRVWTIFSDNEVELRRVGGVNAAVATLDPVSNFLCQSHTGCGIKNWVTTADGCAIAYICCKPITVKKWLKSVYIYGSYRKIKTDLSLFGPPCITWHDVCIVLQRKCQLTVSKQRTVKTRITLSMFLRFLRWRFKKFKKSRFWILKTRKPS